VKWHVPLCGDRPLHTSVSRRMAASSRALTQVAKANWRSLWPHWLAPLVLLGFGLFVMPRLESIVLPFYAVFASYLLAGWLLTPKTMAVEMTTKEWLALTVFAPLAIWIGLLGIALLVGMSYHAVNS
jgi:hypothetical protein